MLILLLKRKNVRGTIPLYLDNSWQLCAGGRGGAVIVLYLKKTFIWTFIIFLTYSRKVLWPVRSQFLLSIWTIKTLDWTGGIPYCYVDLYVKCWLWRIKGCMRGRNLLCQFLRTAYNDLLPVFQSRHDKFIYLIQSCSSKLFVE